eukprot:gene27883-33671_t
MASASHHQKQQHYEGQKCAHFSKSVPDSLIVALDARNGCSSRTLLVLRPVSFLLAMSFSAHATRSFLNIRPKVGIIGSGNWGTAVARRVGLNLQQSHPTESIKLWVHEEMVDGQKLSEIINSKHENVKYLPDIALPKNIRAVSELNEACKDCNILFFIVPHQFLHTTLEQMKGQVPPDTICVSFIKGIDVSPTHGLRRYTEIISEALGTPHMCAVMGANVAGDIAKDLFAETTVASLNSTINTVVSSLLQSPQFQTEVTLDISTVELCGALKNVVALGAGICDGMNMGQNSKAAILRRGLNEIAQFCKLFDKTGNFQLETLFLSCGVADLIATGYAGRNRLCSAEFTRRCLDHLEGWGQRAAKPMQLDGPCPNRDRQEEVCRLWREIETELLNGQKLQGISTCIEVVDWLRGQRGGSSGGHLLRAPKDFPLFQKIYSIVKDGECCDTLFEWEADGEK